MSDVIVNTYVGVLAYADDIVLVAPSASAIRRMFPICDKFADNYDIQFNAQKSTCVFIVTNSKRFLTEC